MHLKSEGKVNDNTYLIDAELFRMEGNLALYVIENDGVRLLIDTGDTIASRKIVKKLQQHDLLPIHKILFTHSHWDHVQGVHKLIKMMKGTDVELLASENAIDNLRNPERMNSAFGYNVDSIENVIPLKEGDVIDLNGLKLKIYDFFGHTQDSIAILDEKNKNLFAGDAILDRYDYETLTPTFMPPEFKESELLNTFKKLRNLKDSLESISLAHYGVWKGEDFQKILNEMEVHHFESKKALIQWHSDGNTLDEITLNFHEKFCPDSKQHTREHILGLKLIIEWLILGLKSDGHL